MTTIRFSLGTPHTIGEAAQSLAPRSKTTTPSDVFTAHEQIEHLAQCLRNYGVPADLLDHEQIELAVAELVAEAYVAGRNDAMAAHGRQQ